MWNIEDMLCSDAAEHLSADDLLAIDHALNDHAIEHRERPSERPGVAGHPGASPKQLAVQQAFWSGKWRTVAVGGANRSAKSTTIGVLCFAKHIRDRAHNGDTYWCIAQDINLMRSVPQKFLWDRLPRSVFPPDVVYTDKLGLGLNPILTLTLPDGRGQSAIYFNTEEMGLDKFKSQSVTGVWWTEAEREPILDALLASLVDQRGFLLIDYLPTQAWHKERLRTNPSVHWTGFSMMDNGHNLPEGEIERLRQEMISRDAAIPIDGKEGSAFGAVYREFDLDRHVCKPFQFPKDALYRCYDYGYRNPFACRWASLLPVGFMVPSGLGGVWSGRELDREVLVFYAKRTRWSGPFRSRRPSSRN